MFDEQGMTKLVEAAESQKLIRVSRAEIGVVCESGSENVDLEMCTWHPSNGSITYALSDGGMQGRGSKVG
jgi:hypothetical protein